eukprot:24247-Eustigmatos_ZCMA.PRE.1
MRCSALKDTFGQWQEASTEGSAAGTEDDGQEAGTDSSTYSLKPRHITGEPLELPVRAAAAATSRNRNLGAFQG